MKDGYRINFMMDLAPIGRLVAELTFESACGIVILGLPLRVFEFPLVQDIYSACN